MIEQGVKVHEMGRIPVDAEPSSVKADSKRSRSLEAHSGHSSTIWRRFLLVYIWFLLRSWVRRWSYHSLDGVTAGAGNGDACTAFCGVVPGLAGEGGAE